MNLLIAAAAVCLLMLASSSATNQRMVCEPVEDVCSAGGQIQSTRRLFGPPGKRGPPGAEGPQGRKGDRGSDGVVDYSLVDDKLENKVAIATEELRAKVERLERTINSMPHLLPKMLDCNEEGGFIYGVKCYFVIVQQANSRSHGEQICRDNNGELGNFVSLEHQTMIMDHARGMDGPSYKYVWTAPKYESSTSTVRLSDGRSLSTSTVRWLSGYPSGSSTGIKLQIYSDASRSDQGFYNRDENSDARGVLCEK